MTATHNYVGDTMSASVPAGREAPQGPGLFEVTEAISGNRLITNVRRLAGREVARGSRLIQAATVLLAVLATGLFVVSLRAQYFYVEAVKHETLSAWIEAIGLDAGMAIFSLLALGLAMAGQSARIERLLVMVCAFGSAAMNYAAADVTSPRSVLAYILPPVFLALVVDRVVAVIRRHVLGDSDRSPWSAAGRVIAVAARLVGVAALYGLRLALAPPSTAKGLRQVVLVAAPLPTAAIPSGIDAADDDVPVPASKKARLVALYQQDPAHGDRSQASSVATRLAGDIGLSPGTARSYVAQYLNAQEATS